MSTEEHERAAARATEARPPCPAVVTVSDTRTLEDDRSGDAAVAALRDASWTCPHRRLVPDDADAIGAVLDGLLAEPEVDAIVFLGGTGIGPRLEPELAEPDQPCREPDRTEPNRGHPVASDNDFLNGHAEVPFLGRSH